MNTVDFITAVLGEMEGNAALGLRDRPGPKGHLNRFWDFKYPEELPEMVEFCEQHRNEDLYMSPLVYGEMRNPDNDKVRRIPENALQSQTAYQDSDTCPPDKFRLPPSIHVVTSTGRYQDYWQLIEPVDAQEAAEASHRIAVAHKGDGSDPSSWSQNKLLRVPNSVNTSHGFPEDVTVTQSGNIYDILDILGAYDDVQLEKRPIMRLPAEISYDSDMDLPDYSSALEKLPNDFNIELLTKEHAEGSDRSKMRYRLLCDLFRTPGLAFEDVLALAWHAPTSRKWKEDPRNIRGLIAEAVKAQTEVAYEAGEGFTPPEEGELFSEVIEDGTEWPRLLSAEERANVENDSNFITRYVAWNQQKLGPAFNAPYARLNAWTILSAGFGDVGYIPRGGGPESCNLYSLGIGDSGTGKSTQLKLWKKVMDELFDHDKAWNIGANASPNALHEKLLERDGKVTVFNADESHGWFKTVNTQQWAEGTYENLALYFDGEVPPILRTGNREISGKSAKTYFNIHLYGTLKGDLSITNVLTKSMFLSGFLARFIWAIGDPKRVTKESLEETNGDGEFSSMGYEPMARQWAAEFRSTRTKLFTRADKTGRVCMNATSEALRRLSQVKWDVQEMYSRHGSWDMLEPCLTRFGPNIRRAATLLAMEEGSEKVELRHIVIAIHAAGEWLHSLIRMIEGVAESDWKRDTDEILHFIMGKPDSRAKWEVVWRKFSGRTNRILLEQIEALKQQGRLKEQSVESGKWLVVNE